MGLFLQTAILKNKKLTEAKECIPEIAKQYPEMDLEPDACQYKAYEAGVGVLFSENTAGYDMLAQVLSEKLKTDVLLLYIYDEDFWGYYFYDNGRELDCFSPLPDYFTGDESEVQRFRGNSQILAKHFCVNPQKLEPYLIRWTDELWEGREEKALVEDEFSYGDCWQMADFMTQLGYPYTYGEELVKTEPLLPTLNQVLLHRLPPQEMSVNIDSMDYVAYKLSNLPNALDYNYVYEVLQNNSQGELAGLEEKTVAEALAILQRVDNANKGNGTKALYILLAFCWHWLGNSNMRYWNLYQAVEKAPNDVMLLRARGLMAGVYCKRHMGVKDNAKLLELDSENREVYLLGRSFYAFINEKRDIALADMKELLQKGFDYEKDSRICWDGFTAEFKQFVQDKKKDMPQITGKTFLQMMRERLQK